MEPAHCFEYLLIKARKTPGIPENRKAEILGLIESLKREALCHADRRSHDYDIKKKWGHRFFYGLCYGINAEYFYSFKDIDGKVLTKTNDPSVRFDLLEFGPFCTFSFGLMINTGKKISR